MGSCETHPDPAQGLEEQAPVRRNPFFEPQAAEGGEAAVLAEYRFISNYEDRFLGRASVVSSREGDLFLCKDLLFSNEQQCESVFRTLLEKKEQQAQVEELLRIKGTRCST